MSLNWIFSQTLQVDDNLLNVISVFDKNSKLSILMIMMIMKQEQIV